MTFFIITLSAARSRLLANIKTAGLYYPLDDKLSSSAHWTEKDLEHEEDAVRSYFVNNVNDEIMSEVQNLVMPRKILDRLEKIYDPLGDSAGFAWLNKLNNIRFDPDKLRSQHWTLTRVTRRQLSTAYV